MLANETDSLAALVSQQRLVREVTINVNALVAKLDPKRNALLLVRRGDSSQFVPVRPAQ